LEELMEQSVLPTLISNPYKNLIIWLMACKLLYSYLYVSLWKWRLIFLFLDLFQS
jgi:hypothetical protein